MMTKEMETNEKRLLRNPNRSVIFSKSDITILSGKRLVKQRPSVASRSNRIAPYCLICVIRLDGNIVYAQHVTIGFSTFHRSLILSSPFHSLQPQRKEKNRRQMTHETNQIRFKYLLCK